jgi:hypothetical protein
MTSFDRGVWETTMYLLIALIFFEQATFYLLIIHLFFLSKLLFVFI